MRQNKLGVLHAEKSLAPRKEYKMQENLNQQNGNGIIADVLRCFWWRLNAIIGYVLLLTMDILLAIMRKGNPYKEHRAESIRAFWRSWNHHLHQK